MSISLLLWLALINLLSFWAFLTWWKLNAVWEILGSRFWYWSTLVMFDFMRTPSML